jgi:hypothetical protein
VSITFGQIRQMYLLIARICALTPLFTYVKGVRTRVCGNQHTCVVYMKFTCLMSQLARGAISVSSYFHWSSTHHLQLIKQYQTRGAAMFVQSSRWAKLSTNCFSFVDQTLALISKKKCRNEKSPFSCPCMYIVYALQGSHLPH